MWEVNKKINVKTYKQETLHYSKDSGAPPSLEYLEGVLTPPMKKYFY